MFHLYITVILGKNTAEGLSSPPFLNIKIKAAIFPLLPPSGTGETNLDEAEALLKPYVEKFPKVS